MLELKEKIKDYMSDYRYNHTLSVAKECKSLADLFHIDATNLVCAAYLHDITKEMSVEDQLQLFKEANIPLDEDTKKSPKTLHSFSAPLFIKKTFPEYANNEVLNAIRFHTTAKANMILIEKLLYLADYIEPTRKFEDCKKLREYFYSSKDDKFVTLDKAILISLKNTIDELSREGSFIHKETLNAYNYLLKQIGE